MTTPAPWATTPSIHPVVDRLRRDARHVLARGGLWTLPRIRHDLSVGWGTNVPPAPWLAAALSGDPWLWQLPDGRWLHVGTAVWERWFTSAWPPGLHRTGVLPVGIDLQPALLGHRGWERIPIWADAGTGLAERATSPSGRAVLVCPPRLLPPADELVMVSGGPEGIRLSSGSPDPLVDARYRNSVNLHRRLSRPLTTAPPAGSDLPRPWSPVDVELRVLAGDGTLRRRPTGPLSTVASEEPALGRIA